MVHIFLAFCTSNFWSLAACKNRGRRPGESYHVICGMAVICCHASSLQPLYYMRLILHSVLATKMGQALAESYTKLMKHTQAKSHDFKGLLSDKCENTRQWCNLLVEWKYSTIWSCTACITAIPHQLSFELRYVLQVGPTSSLEVVSVL